MKADKYHEATKHSPESVRRSVHFLDWDNQPLPFKRYRGLTEVELPPVDDRSKPAALDVLGYGLLGGSRRRYDLAPDGDRFVVRRPSEGGLTGDSDPFTGLIYVQNWLDELKERVPVP